MYQIPANEISLIFDHDITANAGDFLSIIQNSGAPFDQFTLLSDNHEGFSLLVDDNFHIVIKVKDHPMVGRQFDAALAMPIIKQRELHWRHLIRQHQSSMSITIGRGTLGNRGPQSIERRQIERMLSLPERAEIWNLTNQLIAKLIDIEQPLALLFHATKQLIEPAQIQQFMRAGVPAATMINPAPFTSGAMVNSRAMIGFNAIGSEVLLGRSLILHEVDQSLDQAIIWAGKAIHKCLDDGALMANNHHSGDFHGATLDIRQRRPSEVYPFGTFEVLLSDIRQKNEPRVTADTLRQAIFGRRPWSRSQTTSH